MGKRALGDMTTTRRVVDSSAVGRAGARGGDDAPSRPHIRWSQELVTTVRKYQPPTVQLKPQLWWRQRPSLQTQCESITLPIGTIKQLVVPRTMRWSRASLLTRRAAEEEDGSGRELSDAPSQQRASEMTGSGKKGKTAVMIQHPETQAWYTVCTFSGTDVDACHALNLSVVLSHGVYRIKAVGTLGTAVDIFITQRAISMINI